MATFTSRRHRPKSEEYFKGIRVMDSNRVGNSLIAFGATILLTSIVASFFTGGFVIDLVALFVIVGACACQTVAAVRRSGALAIMALYLCVLLIIIAAPAILPDRIKVGDKALPAWAGPLVIGFWESSPFGRRSTFACWRNCCEIKVDSQELPR
jgi:hypothetical protein